MNLKRLINSYKTKMIPTDFEKFKRFCEMSVDLNAKNTANHKSKDLAEFQIHDLAEKFIKK